MGMRRLLLTLLALLLLPALAACGMLEIATPEGERLPGSPGPAPGESTSTPAGSDCPGNLLTNGGFELGEEGWIYEGQEHGRPIPALPLARVKEQVHSGKQAALLGGYETASDQLSQSFIVPANGLLSLWWMYHSPDPIPERDMLAARLVLPNNEDGLPLFFAAADIVQDHWQAVEMDLSAYAGQRLTLEISTYNDNYYFSWLAVDDICLTSRP